MTQPSGKQIRAARALIGWDRDELAARSDVSVVTIHNFENDQSVPKKETIDKMVVAFRHVGIEFIENDGVRRAPTDIEVYEGRERFDDFMAFMYDYLERFGGNVCIYIQDEGLLRGTRKNIEAHRVRMAALADAHKIHGRILAAKGVDHSDWAEIRRMPEDPQAPRVSFMTFGDNLALISFDHKTPPYVVLHKSGPFAAAYEKSFNAAWEDAQIINA